MKEALSLSNDFSLAPKWCGSFTIILTFATFASSTKEFQISIRISNHLLKRIFFTLIFFFYKFCEKSFTRAIDDAETSQKSFAGFVTFDGSVEGNSTKLCEGCNVNPHVAVCLSIKRVKRLQFTISWSTTQSVNETRWRKRKIHLKKKCWRFWANIKDIRDIYLSPAYFRNHPPTHTTPRLQYLTYYF